jgi:hypothetical protein
MLHKSITSIIVAIYFLTPYLISNNNVHCQCGCQEFICYCCKTLPNFDDVTSLSECRCNIIDESYIQSPAVIEYAWETEFFLDLTAHPICYNNDSPSPGYQKPPMKPPPSV